MPLRWPAAAGRQTAADKQVLALPHPSSVQVVHRHNTSLLPDLQCTIAAILPWQMLPACWADVLVLGLAGARLQR